MKFVNKTTTFAMIAAIVLSGTLFAATPPDSLVVDNGGNVGVGVATPTSQLHIKGTDAEVLVENTGPTVAVRKLFILHSDSNQQFSMKNTGSGDEWVFNSRKNSFRISKQGSGGVEMELFETGNMTIRGNLTELSSRQEKHNIEKVDAQAILSKVAALPIAHWTYNHDTEGTRHLGPMAEDFHFTFGLGNDSSGISSLDTGGVALAAIQGLNELVHEKDAEIEALRAELEDLRKMVQALASRDHLAVLNGPQ